MSDTFLANTHLKLKIRKEYFIIWIFIVLLSFKKTDTINPGIIAYSGYEPVHQILYCHTELNMTANSNIRKGKLYVVPFYTIPKNACKNKNKSVKVVLRPTYDPFTKTFTSRMLFYSIPIPYITSNQSHWVCHNENMINMDNDNEEYEIMKDNSFELTWPASVIFRKKKGNIKYDEIGCAFQDLKVKCICRWLDEADRKNIKLKTVRMTYYEYRKQRMGYYDNSIVVMMHQMQSSMSNHMLTTFLGISWLIITTLISVLLFIKLMWEQRVYNKGGRLQGKDERNRMKLKKALKMQEINARKKNNLEGIKKLWIEEMIEDRKNRDYIEEMLLMKKRGKSSEKF